MRPVLVSDVTAAARALLSVREPRRNALCEDLLREAEYADRFTRRVGRPHPVFGNGTLLAAARARKLVCEPTLDDAAYRAAIATVLRALDRAG